MSADRRWKGRARPAGEGVDRVTSLRGATALAALDTALNALDAPAIIVDLGGDVLHANTNAQLLLDRDRGTVSRSLADAIAGAPADLQWDLTPLQGTEAPHGFLAVLRPARRGPVVADPVCAASARWRLTSRQTEVLRLVARGLTNVLIADTLEIGEGTVEFHLHAIFDKAGVDNRATLIVKMLEG